MWSSKDERILHVYAEKFKAPAYSSLSPCLLNILRILPFIALFMHKPYFLITCFSTQHQNSFHYPCTIIKASILKFCRLLKPQSLWNWTFLIENKHRFADRMFKQRREKIYTSFKFTFILHFGRICLPFTNINGNLITKMRRKLPE